MATLFWLGIDLGTTNSCVYKVDLSSTGDVVPSPLGNTVTPSVVSVGRDEILCGDMAKNTDPKSTFFGFKRTIGRGYKDCKLWKSACEWPFVMSRPKNEDDEPVYTASHGGRVLHLSPKDLYVHLLRYMLKDANVAMAAGVTVSVPAHFDTVQREATKETIVRAGAHASRVHIVNEPTAAAVAFLDGRPGAEGTFLVIDVGGGTVDCSLVHVNKDGSVRVADSKGTSEVGGETITDALVALKRTRRDAGAAGVSALRESIEDAKKRLSVQQEATFSNGAVLTRSEVEDVAEPMLTAVCDIAASVVARDAPLTAVVLCGGTTRMPCLRKRIAALYPSATVSTELNPLTAVARGAALVAKSRTAVAHTPAVNLSDILATSIGVRVHADDMYVMFKAGTVLPADSESTFRPLTEVQSFIEFVVYQGNNPSASKNTELGRFRVCAVPHVLAITVSEDGLAEIVAWEEGDPDRKHVHMEKVNIWKQ